ncbi:AEL_collapsed_G0032040.mRNA.1.CDS.1 [Saccharomyces cerevisiae]|nr:AEL_collapsed_G0032040.mRNA.1.CDS.1 [Saccharomyces cerevisiae]
MTITSAKNQIRIAIDRGGTFTDCIGNPGTGKIEDDTVIKLLSVDPKNYPDAPLEGIRRLLEVLEHKTIPRGIPLDISNVRSLRMGTTLATNCALERNGERYERVTLEDFSEDPYFTKSSPNEQEGILEGNSGEMVRVIKKPDESSVRSILKVLYASGIKSIAIAFLHSYTFPDHERIVGNIAREIGFSHVSLSSEVSPMIKFLPRAHSSVADAYLTPVIKKYLNSISAGLSHAEDTHIQFMQSDGGLVDGGKFSGLKSILSGPAGGVIGYSSTCYDKNNNIPLIGFDMGGTSTDVSRYGDGRLEHVFETVTAGIIIQSPQLDIHTVAAGGSSILSWKNGLFRVGPDSAAADPGPAAYRKGGPLTITDANLFLGRLVPEFFPKIFGPNEDESLDLETTTLKFRELTDVINKDLNSNLTMEEVAYGFIKVANECMARPVRAITEAKGHVVSQHRLVSFGGAGGQHAIAVADSLGIDTVLIHRYSSILSAYGIFLADVIEENQEPCSFILGEPETILKVKKRFLELSKNPIKNLLSQSFSRGGHSLGKIFKCQI